MRRLRRREEVPERYKECVWGQSIYALIDPTRQERALQDDLRDTSIVHLETSAKWAVRARLSSMVLVAAKQVWNVGLQFFWCAAMDSIQHG